MATTKDTHGDHAPVTAGRFARLPREVAGGNFMTLAERLEQWSIPEPNSGCRIWIGALNSKGYGHINILEGGVWRTHRTHRVAYELAKGPIPDGLEPHHKCKIRCCIEANHLEAITHGENIAARSSIGPRKWFCECGAPYEIVATKHGLPVRGCRSCRRAARAKEWKEKHR